MLTADRVYDEPKIQRREHVAMAMAMVKKWRNANNATSQCCHRTPSSSNENDGTLARQEKQSKCTGCRYSVLVQQRKQTCNHHEYWTWNDKQNDETRACTHRRSTSSYTQERVSTPCPQPTISGFVFSRWQEQQRWPGILLVASRWFCTSEHSVTSKQKRFYQNTVFWTFWTTRGLHVSTSASPSTCICTMHLLRSIYLTLRCTVQYCNQWLH